MFGEGLDLLRREKLSVVQKIGKIIELFSAQGDFSVDAPCTRLTKYRETAEHEEGKVTDPMHLSTQSLNL